MGFHVLQRHFIPFYYFWLISLGDLTESSPPLPSPSQVEFLSDTLSEGLEQGESL